MEREQKRNEWVSLAFEAGKADLRRSLKVAIGKLPDGGVINIRPKGKKALIDLINQS